MRKVLNSLLTQNILKIAVSYPHLSVSEIATRLGTQDNYVVRVLQQQAPHDPKLQRYLTLHVNLRETSHIRLRPEEKRRMFQRYFAGETVGALCREYSIGSTYFNHWLHRFKKRHGGEREKIPAPQPVPETIAKPTIETYGRKENATGLQADLSGVVLERNPFVSVHVASFNEKRVIDRLLTACTSFDYPNYEVIVADDSNDETVDLVNKWAHHPRVKISHRENRDGFKGAALQEALVKTDPKAEFVMVFDADFIPYPDSITQFLKYFQLATGSLSSKQGSNIAAVQGYQWHVLNKSENWITRGVRSEYSGSYVIERSGAEIYHGLKQISGSVYMIRRDVLQSIGWGTSITEDFQLTLKLYEAGYKVVYTPYIQAPGEAVSTIKRLIRQRMRWAEGHSFNIKKMLGRLLFGRWEEKPSQSSASLPGHANAKDNRERKSNSRTIKQWNNKNKVWIPSPLTFPEKLELIYLAPYYLQAAFFIMGTLCWFLAEAVFQVRLPFWTEVWGWSLVLTNMFALPLMNMIGMFMEESDEKDYIGLISFIVLSYIVAPFQAYASVKGFIEKEEGPWFRTPKTGRITDTFLPGRISRFVRGLFGASFGAADNNGVKVAPSLNYTSNNQNVQNWNVYNNPKPVLAKAFLPVPIRKVKRRIFSRAMLAGMMVVVIMVNYLSYFTPSAAAAAPNPTIEQQINIIDQNYSTPLTTYAPTDNSLGMVKWDGTKYNGETVYFETVMKTTAGEAWCNDNSGITCTTSWTSRTKITFDNSASGADLTDFPVMIKLSSASGNIDFNKTKAGGDDIRFVDANAETVVLSHEVEKWDEPGGESIVWVKVPTITAASTTDYIWMYYNNSNAANGQDVTNVWETNYKSVWHLKEVGDGTLNEYKDSTANLFHARGGNGTSANVPARVDGSIGYAQDFDGSTEFINSASSTVFDSNSAFTMEMWINADTCGEGGEGAIFAKEQGLQSYLCGATNDITLTWSAGGSAFTSDNSVVFNQWHHVVGTYNGSGTAAIYVDGVDRTADSSVPEADIAGMVVIGADDAVGAPTEFSFDGTIDEVRISSMVRVPDWIEADYLNTKASSTFTSFGSEEANGAATVYASLYTSGGSAVTGSEISTTSTTYARVRSSAITANLVNGTTYTVRVKGSGAGINIQAARLIIVQTATPAITDTVTQIEVGANETIAAATETSLTNPKYYQYDNDKFSGTKNSYFEATLKAGTITSSGAAGFNSPAASGNCVDGGSTPDPHADAVAATLTTPGNAFSDNETYATASVDNTHSKWIKCTTYGFSIPTNATINGVIVSVDRNASSIANGGVIDAGVRLVTGGTIGTTDKKTATVWPVTSADTYEVHGGITDMWGFTTSTLTPAIVNATDFGAAIAFVKDSGTGAAITGSVDHVRISVYFSVPYPATATAVLYNVTSTAIVTNSSVSDSTTAWTHARGASAMTTNWDTVNDDQYEVRVKSSVATVSASIANAKIIIEQTQAGGITALQTVQHHANHVVTDADTTYTDQDFLNEFNPANFYGGTFVASFEATLKASAGTGYAKLKNDTGADEIDTATTSEVTHNTTTYTRKTSSPLQANSDWPTSAKDMDTIVKNSATNTTSVANAWLLIYISNLQVPENLLFAIPLIFFLPYLIRRRRKVGIILERLRVNILNFTISSLSIQHVRMFLYRYRDG